MRLLEIELRIRARLSTPRRPDSNTTHAAHASQPTTMIGMTPADASTEASATPTPAPVFAPGLTVRVRDELWLITSIIQSVDGTSDRGKQIVDYLANYAKHLNWVQ